MASSTLPGNGSRGDAYAVDAAYQLFRTKITTLPPWSLWDDDACAGPVEVWIVREVINDYTDRGVFGALEFKDSPLSVPLAEAILKDAEVRLTTIQPDRYSATVGARIVTAYRNLIKRLTKELESVGGRPQ